jgi:hypothetical protein
VDSYYSLQGYRIAAANQRRKLLEDTEPSELMLWLDLNLITLEKQIAAGLDKWSAAQRIGRYARSITGIGPIIAAGLVANLDITRAPTPGHIWSFCGLNPTVKWGKGQKRPWSASMKTLCWKMGESFVKVSNHKSDIYGHLYVERKAYETANNESGKLAHVAAERLAQPGAKKLDQGLIDILKAGKLPQIALHERAKRWACKVWLSHLWERWYELHYGTVPPAPYALAHLPGHVHKIPAPPMVP